MIDCQRLPLLAAMNTFALGASAFVLLLGSDLLGQRGQRARRGFDATRMLERFDANKDGKLTAAEVDNDRMWRRIARADSNEDGTITKAEMEAMGGGRGGRGGGDAAWKFLLGKYDANKDGKVSADEYQRDASTFKRLDRNEDGVLTAADWADGDRRRGGRDARERTAELEAGDVAPDFELTLVADAKKKVKLSSFAGDRPVALVFGSCT